MPDVDFFRPKDLPLRGFKQVEPRPKGSHFVRMARGPVFPTLRRWIPDNLSDRIYGWLWPRFREVIAAAIFALAGACFAWWAMSSRPWGQ